MGSDGVVIIDTDLNTTPLEKRLRKLESKLENEEVDLKFKESNVEEVKRELKEVEATIKNINKANQGTNERIKSLSKQYSTFNQRIAEGEHLTVDEYQRYGYLENELSKLQGLQQASNQEMDKYNNKFNKLNDALTKAETLYNKQKNRVTETRQEVIELNNEIKKADVNNIKNSIDGVGKAVEKVTKKVGRWALAVFGIRSAYMAVRNAINIISQYDDKLAADIQYIKNALAFALEPVVRAIVNLIKQIMYYVAYIIKAWTGKNIFENANKSLKKSVGTAKQLQKTLAGFDEMNILQDNSSDSGGGGTSPSMDLSKIQGDVPGWVQFIADNGKLIESILLGIAAALVAIKLGASGIQALGIGIAVAGIVYSIQSILQYINDPSWSNFGDILIGIGATIVGLAIAFGAWPVALAGAIVLMVGIITKFWDKIKEFLENLVNNIYTLGENIKTWLVEKLGDWGKILSVAVDAAVGIVTEAIKIVIHLFDGLFSGVKKILDGIIMIFKGDFKNGIVNILKGIANIIIGVLNVLIDGLNAVISPIRGLIVAIGKIMGKGWTMDNIRIPNIPKLARGGIVNNPGQGVMMGSYVAGEKGPEAVLPLNDDTMDRLGESIARHMVINANIVNEMNGRIISRELKKIESENNFAYNG